MYRLVNTSELTIIDTRVHGLSPLAGSALSFCFNFETR